MSATPHHAPSDGNWLDDPAGPVDVSLVGRIAFGTAERAPLERGEGRHLALLSNETLELDLTDPQQRGFGDYELLELIGEGGMGVVYRARQLSLDREVAVKLLAAGPWASLAYVERFRREAQNAARMQHPNIVAIYEVGENDELHFFSMRLIGGPSLASVIRHEGRMSAPRAAHLLRVVAEAVDYAHRLGVLHLDLKPANVLIDESGTPHIADFGLARRLEQGLAPNRAEVSGTPSYMAPEQATAAQPITPATDIWGLGAILYELVTGEPPFLAATPRATLKLVVEGTLRNPRRLTPDLPLDMTAIIRKCLARDAAQRYRTARELAEDLTRFIEGREVGARRLGAAQRAWRWARREPKFAAMAGVAALALVAGMAATIHQWRRAEDHRRDAEEQKQFAENNAAVSRERLWSSRHDAALRLERDGKGFDALPQLIANIEEQEQAGRSADVERREVGMVLNRGVVLLDRLIVADANPMTAALSPDGSLLAVALNDVSVRWYGTDDMRERGRVDLSEVPTSDGTPRVPQLLSFIGNRRLRVSLEWYSYLPNPSENDTVLVDLDTARVVAPPAAFGTLSHVTYAEDGRHALLFNERKEAQFWQVDPWLARSPLIGQMADYTLPYFVGREGSAILRPHHDLSSVDRLEPRAPAIPTALQLPPHATLTAWRQSGDGSQFALGDANGQVFLVDLRSLKSRQLPMPGGTSVSWLAFSEDDNWLAVARNDGTAFAFDVVSGMPLHSGQLAHEFALRHVALSRRHRLLVASGNGDTALWRLPLPGRGGTPATLLTSGPTRATHAGPYWAGVSLQAGLLATAGFAGEIRLWRLPPPPLRPELSARAFDERTEFDGDHVVDVAFDRVRVVSLRDAARTTSWRDLPAPISFAELAAGARTLVVVARHTLHVLDATTLHDRYAPVPLPADPLHFALDRKRSRLFLAFGENGREGFIERIGRYDLETGSTNPRTASVKGPLRRFVLSADGARMLLVGPVDGETALLDTDSVRIAGAYAHDAERPVLWADFASDSSAWLITRSADETQVDDAELIRWDGRSGEVVERRQVHGIRPVGVVTVGNKALLAARDRLLLDPAGPEARSSLRLSASTASSVFAVSHDGRWVAHASDRDVQLYEARTLTPVGVPLHAAIGTIDGIVQLAFAPDDGTLLGRTSTHHWLVWNARADLRPVADLRTDAAILTSDEAEIPRVPGPGESARLRSRDPGPWSPPVRTPAPPSARVLGGADLPPRPAGLSPLLLDLSAFYTSAPGSTYNFEDSVIPSIREMPFGVARIDGVDYDLRGAAELRWGEGGRIGLHSAIRLKNSLRGIRVPEASIAAFHVLVYAAYAVPVAADEVYARLRLHYRGGAEAVLPMRVGRELADWDGRGSSIGWIENDDLRLSGEFRSRLVNAPRLANPHPERLVETVDVEASNENFSTPVVFAITAEPLAAAH